MFNRSVLVALGLIVGTGCIKAVPPGMAPDDFVTYTTDDGWVGAVRHFEGDGPPLLVVHGMGANHYNWDYHPDVSPIDELVEAGWDVWVAELRGDPNTLKPYKKADKRYTFDDHAERDIPAAVDAVLAATGESELYWLGHSMGGMLLYTAVSEMPEKITAGVAVCSPGQFQHPSKKHKLVRGMGWTVAGKGKIHASTYAKMVAWWGKGNPLYAQLGNKRNFDWGLAKGLARHSLTDLPFPMARQAVDWMNDGELTRLDGTPWVDFESDVPILALGAPIDQIVPEADVRETCDRFVDCDYVSLSMDNGFSVDHGHVDPVIGKTAETEVYPVILGWLDEQRDGVAADAP